MINAVTLRNINTKIIEGKLSKIYISFVSNLYPFGLIGTQEVARSFKKVGDP